MNYGVNLEREKLAQSKEDYIFGATSPTCIAQIPVKQRKDCLPFGEVQRGVDDMMDCATRSPINILETKLNYMLRNKLFTDVELAFLADNGYITEGGVELSDAYIAILSGTTQQGNSLKEPLQAMRDYGVIPKSMLPLVKTMTWEQYHDPKRVTEACRALGAKFKELFTIWYERVDISDFDTVLDTDVLDVAGYAWSKPKNGIYPATENMPNHAFMNFQKKYFIFDNYIADKTYIKHLAEDYGFLGYGYRLYLSRSVTAPENEQQKLIGDIFDMLIMLVQKLRKMLGY